MDRDDMRDNIERASACTGCGNLFGCMYPDCAAGERHRARSDFETHSSVPLPQYNAPPPIYRRSRREAEVAAHRRVVRIIMTAAVGLLGAGILLQLWADDLCGAGMRWDADRWQCVAAR